MRGFESWVWSSSLTRSMGATAVLEMAPAVPPAARSARKAHWLFFSLRATRERENTRWEEGAREDAQATSGDQEPGGRGKGWWRPGREPDGLTLRASPQLLGWRATPPWGGGGGAGAGRAMARDDDTGSARGRGSRIRSPLAAAAVTAHAVRAKALHASAHAPARTPSSARPRTPARRRRQGVPTPGPGGKPHPAARPLDRLEPAPPRERTRGRR